MEGPWTILELAELAADALAVTQPVRANGRVRDVPNERLVRWYVTVGLVDPPLSRRGRVAQYGRRHLLQLVAVKRRQAEGRSLAEIQEELAGATDEALAVVARVPAALSAPQAPGPAPGRFWARSAGRPEPAATGWAREHDPGAAERDSYAAERDSYAAERAGRPEPAAPGWAGERDPGAGERDHAAAERDSYAGERAGPAAAAAAGGGGADGGRSGLVRGIRLAPGVTLLLEDRGREPGPDDVTEIVNAARPLLEVLGSRGLRGTLPGHPADVPGTPSDVSRFAEGSQT